MDRVTPKDLALATALSLTIGIVSWVSTGNIGNAPRYFLWTFVIFYLSPIIAVKLVKPKSEAVKIVIAYITMAISGFLLSKPFGIPQKDIEPFLYGAIFGAIFGGLLHSGWFEKLEKFIDKKLQPNIKAKD
ncbi:hypothetical protein [Thermococcus sp.]|uniref:hypothetical protein n=1 Tax=Thermococcus sp. TaxID=35749 RepID=UPI00263244BA|nr:hypothetical protein [Thermococcus sp.]